MFVVFSVGCFLVNRNKEMVVPTASNVNSAWYMAIKLVYSFLKGVLNQMLALVCWIQSLSSIFQGVAIVSLIAFDGIVAALFSCQGAFFAYAL